MSYIVILSLRRIYFYFVKTLYVGSYILAHEGKILRRLRMTGRGVYL